MRYNIVSLKLKYNHGTTEYRGIFSRYLPWSKINGTAQHYSTAALWIMVNRLHRDRKKTAPLNMSK